MNTLIIFAKTPSAEWTAQQIVEAFPEDTAPKYMIRDRDGIYGDQFCRRVEGLGIEEVLTAPRSPWQNPYAERLVGSVRRECLDHLIVLGEQHLRRILHPDFSYYHRSRTHLSLWTRTRRSRDPSTRPPWGRSSSCPKLAACTTATNALRLERRLRPGKVSVAEIPPGSLRYVVICWSVAVQAAHAPNGRRVH